MGLICTESTSLLVCFFLGDLNILESIRVGGRHLQPFSMKGLSFLANSVFEDGYYAHEKEPSRLYTFPNILCALNIYWQFFPLMFTVLL